MVKMHRNRFNEIAQRKLMKIKIRWFEPLNKLELEKLGIKDRKEQTISL